MLNTLIIATAAGILGTGMGGVVGLFFAKSSKSVLSYLLSFAAGVMLSIACFELIPEALEISSLFLVIIFLMLGIVAVQLLNVVIDRITGVHEQHTTLEGIHHQADLLEPDTQKSMLKAGMVMFSAIALHNLPEGMAIGSSAAHDSKMGFALALLIALHNIPEGMSIGVPLMEGGMNKGKAVLLTAISGAPTLVGGLIGSLLGGGGNILVAASLSLAAGAMLYVTYCEIIPQVILLNNGRKPAVFTLIGIIFGLTIVNIFK